MAKISIRFRPLQCRAIAPLLLSGSPWPDPRPVILALGLLAAGRRAVADETGSPVDDLKRLSIEQLMDVEVTSVARRPEKLLDAAASVEVITNEDIRRSGASLIPEALRLADNLEVAQKSASDWGITARGFNTDLANKLLVMMDGRTVYTPLYSGVFWNLQDYLLEDIDRIEVVSGPGGALWGANAVNGVINITTRKAQDTQGFFGEAGGGGQLRKFAGARYGGALAPHVYFRVYGKYMDHDGQAIADGSDASDFWHMGRGGFRIDSDASPQNTWTLQGDAYAGVEAQEAGGDSDVSGENVLGRWSHAMADDAEITVQSYYDRTHLASLKPTNGFAPAGILTDDLDTCDLDFQHRLGAAGRHRVVWGLGFRFTHDDVGNAPGIAFLPASLGQSLFSGFLQDEISMRKDLLFTWGTKLEHNDYTGFEMEPSLRLQWNATARQMLWTAVSRAVRTPSRIDRDLREPTLLASPLPPSLLNGGADFQSEAVMAYELGCRAELGSQATTSLTIFYNDYDHLRSTTPGAPASPTFGFPFVFHNNLEGESHGLELSVTCQVLAGWRLRGGYDLLEEHLHVKPGQVDFNHALNETADPAHQLSLHSTMDLPHAVELDTAVRWVDTLPINNGGRPATVPAYAEMDVHLAWHPTSALELSITGQNLLHDHHPEYGVSNPTREEIERSVFGKAAWGF